eukprot:2138987-Pleurochrysis_carterae.AAC.1
MGCPVESLPCERHAKTVSGPFGMLATSHAAKCDLVLSLAAISVEKEGSGRGQGCLVIDCGCGGLARNIARHQRELAI